MKLTSSLLFVLISCIAASPLQRLSIISSRQLKACPPNGTTGTLPPNYDSPWGKWPVSRKDPDHAFGPSRLVVTTISPNDFCIIFEGRIPAYTTGATCTLEFLFPSSGPYFYDGGGHFTFTGYAIGTAPYDNTTYNNQPPAGPSPPTPPSVMSPGNAYTFNMGPCEAQGRDGSVASGMLCSDDTTFDFMQLWGSTVQCPLGVFFNFS